LIELFDVSIDVEKEGDAEVATIVGIGNNPRNALAKIQEILFQNEDIERTILVRSIVKNKLLSNSGSLIKRLQSELFEVCGSSVMVYVHKEEKDDQKSSLATMVVKGPRSLIDEAIGYVSQFITKYESAVLTVTLDSMTIAHLLEKGGLALNKLRSRFAKEVEVFLSRENNEILILSDDDTVKDTIRKELDHFAAQNQVYMFKTDTSLVGLIFGSKMLRDSLLKLGVILERCSSTDSILIRGSNETVSSREL
jgi:hypothetical protein